jgi:hypothetical protein
MKEFIFGSLSTSEKRLNYLRDQRRGLRHQHQLEPFAPKQGDRPIITVTAGLDTAVDGVMCNILEPERLSVPLQCVKIEWDLLNWGYLQYWQCELPERPQGTVVRYQVEASQTSDDNPLLADNGATFSYYVADPDPPSWTAEAVVYQIFPDRFRPGRGREWNDHGNLADVYR